MALLTERPAMGKPGGPGGRGGKFMARFDSNKDGKVSKEEFTGPPFIFQKLDKNGDGFISKEDAPKGPPPGGPG